MNRDQKAVAIEAIATDIKESEAIFAVDYRGISVPQISDLRTKLREVDAKFAVVKNTLTERAADQLGVEGLKQFLAGPTALTYVKGDAAVTAKILDQFKKDNDILELKGGMLGDKELSSGQLGEIAKLPAYDVLIGRFVGTVASPLSGLVTSLNGLISGLASQLGQIRDQELVGSSASE